MEEQKDVQERLKVEQMAYTQKHGIDRMLAGMMQDLIITQRDDPLEFLVALLNNPDNSECVD